MTPEDYLAQADVIDREMQRCRKILDRHAWAKSVGIQKGDPPLIQKTLAELLGATERMKTLNASFWP